MDGDALSNRRTALVLLVTVGLLAWNASQALHCGQDTGCVDPYWTHFWLVSWSDGVSRRAALGQLVRALSGPTVGWALVNGLASAFAGAVLATAYALFFGRAVRRPGWPLVALLVVSGPVTTVFLEVLGDPLHLATAITLAFVLAADRLPGAVRVVAAVLVAVAVALVHEASVFLLLPAIFVTLAAAAGRPLPWWRPLPAMAVALAVFAVFLDAQAPAGEGMALVTRSGATVHAPVDTLPTFAELLRAEAVDHFGSPKGFARLVAKVVGSLLWPTLAALAIARRLRMPQVVTTFVVLLGLSLPLYAIAHDWGRFAVDSLVVTLALHGRLDPRIALAVPRPVTGLVDRLLAVGDGLFARAGFLAALPFLYASHPMYRVDGLYKVNLVLVLGALAVAWAVRDADPERG